MVINSSNASAGIAALSTRPPEQRTAFKELGQALKSGDLAGAKQAYADVVRNAPAGATWNPDSAFAQVGKALASGDVDAAKSAFGDMLKSHHHSHDTPALPPIVVPTSSSTGGVAGGIVNLTA